MAAFSLPTAFVKRMQAQLGKQYPAFEEALQQAPPASVRLNPAKPYKLPWGGAAPVPWHAEAYHLPERPYFTHEPAFWAGCYYVQEASSMLIGSFLPVGQRPLRVLDLCGAPGGKTTLLQAALPPGSVLIANEQVPKRARILAENLSRWGLTGHQAVTNNRPEDFLPAAGLFDLVLVDAPCSGEGLWRKQPEAITEWSLEAVSACAARQAGILQVAKQLVAPSGRLVYSTCTFAPEENEQQVEAHFVQDASWQFVALNQAKEWGLTEATGAAECLGYRAYPHRLQGEGFFVSAWQRNGQPPAPDIPSGGKVTGPWVAWLDEGLLGEIVETKGGFRYQAPALRAFIAQLPKLKYVLAGLPLGQAKGPHLIPEHALAQSPLLTPGLPKLELDKSQALQYLRKQQLHGIAPHKGWQQVCYQGHGLGWGKGVPGRLNNYLPAHLRVLH